MRHQPILLIGNWKMNPESLKKAAALFEAEIRALARLFSEAREIGGVPEKRLKVVICPPFPYLFSLNEIRSRLRISEDLLALGAQDVFYEAQGAYTGEVSPLMLKDLGVEYVLIGHSERRRILKETDELINKKLHATLQAGLAPVFLVGDETSPAYHGSLISEQAEQERELLRISKQIQKGLKGINAASVQKIIFGYEPVWAISSFSGGKSAESSYAQSMVARLKQEVLSKLYDIDIVEKLLFIYGGSVDTSNIQSFLAEKNLHGVLPGSASLRPEELSGMAEIILQGNF